MTSSQNSPTASKRTAHDRRTGGTAPTCSFWERRLPVCGVLEWIRHRWLGVVLMGFAAMSGGTRMALTQSATVTFSSVADTSLKPGTRNTNHSAETILLIQASGSGRALL